MAALTWDQPGDRFYETGIDRGVLYLPNGVVIPWNGLVSVVEKTVANEGTPLYFDGIKYGDMFAPGDFAGTIRAITYPEQFLQVEGILDAGNGLFVANQNPQRFGMSYRTKVINDDGTIHYKVHVLYNLLAFPSDRTYQTTGSSTEVVQFEWNVTAVPEEAPGFRPTAHLILDTRFMGQLLLDDLEATLYGNAAKNPRLPRLSTLISFISGWVIIRIVDNLDGTWSATGPDNFIRMAGEDEIEILQANAVFIDSGEKYVITDLTY